MTVEEELRVAAANLCQRALLLDARTSTVPPAAWQEFAPELVPKWWISLLAEFPLAGLVLEYRGHPQASVETFGFMAASEYQAIFGDSDFHLRLTSHGWFPIGAGSNGDLWLTRAVDGTASEVFLLDHSGWDGGEPTRRNGLRFASSRLSYLMLTMGISEASYYSRTEGPTRILWYPDRSSTSAPA